MIRRMLLAFLLFVASASPALAQGVAVAGTVVDESGARVAGATVTLTGLVGRETRVTNAAGEYQFAPVAPGSYQISAASAGFASDRQEAVIVGTSAVTVPALTLTIAPIGETVVVSASRAESTVLDAPATMTVVTAATLAALPSQSYADVLRAVPGM